MLSHAQLNGEPEGLSKYTCNLLELTMILDILNIFLLATPAPKSLQVQLRPGGQSHITTLPPTILVLRWMPRSCMTLSTCNLGICGTMVDLKVMQEL